MELSGEDLTIEQVWEVAAAGAEVAVAARAIDHMVESRAVVDRLAAGDAPIYGVNTGVGLLADVRIPRQRSGPTAAQRGALALGRRGRSAGARGGARHDADPRQRAGQGIFGHPPGGRRAPLRPAEPRRDAGGAVAGQRRRERRSGAAGAHGAGADRRRRSRIRRRALPRRRGAARAPASSRSTLRAKEGISA